MRRRKVLPILAPLVLAGVAGLVALIRLASCHPSDASLIQNFNDHRTDFTRLAEMFEEDSRAAFIYSSSVGLESKDGSLARTYLEEGEAWPHPESELGFTRRRWDEYRGLFERLKIRGVARCGDRPGVLFIPVSFDFTFFYEAEAGTTVKGYVYSVNGVHRPLAASLDWAGVGDSATSFRKLDDHWYLYYQLTPYKPE